MMRSLWLGSALVAFSAVGAFIGSVEVRAAVSQDCDASNACPIGQFCVAIADNKGIEARKCITAPVCVGDRYGSCPSYTRGESVLSGVCAFIESSRCDNPSVACTTKNNVRGFYSCITATLCDTKFGGACSSSCPDGCNGNGVCDFQDIGNARCLCNDGFSGPSCAGGEGTSTTSPSDEPTTSSSSSSSSGAGDTTGAPTSETSTTAPTSSNGSSSGGSGTATSGPSGSSSSAAPGGTSASDINGSTSKGTSANSQTSDSGLSSGAIAGIVIAVVAAVALVAAIAFYVAGKKRPVLLDAETPDVNGPMTPRREIALM